MHPVSRSSGVIYTRLCTTFMDRWRPGGILGLSGRPGCGLANNYGPLAGRSPVVGDRAARHVRLSVRRFSALAYVCTKLCGVKRHHLRIAVFLKRIFCFWQKRTVMKIAL